MCRSNADTIIAMGVMLVICWLMEIPFIGAGICIFRSTRCGIKMGEMTGDLM
jgi:hypothetical protein